MKSDTSEPNYPKSGNKFFDYFTNPLKTLCKTLPILFAESSYPFHSLRACLIWSYILNL